MPADYQRAAPASAAAESADAGGPCPGVTVAEVLAPSTSGGPGGHVYAKDVLPPLVGSWSWADSAAAVDDLTTRCARYLTDANGDVCTAWSGGWCAPPGCPTPAPPHGPCSCDVPTVPCSAVRLCPCSFHLIGRQCGMRCARERAMDNARGETIMIEQPSFIRSVVCRCIVAVWLDWRAACLLRGKARARPRAFGGACD